MSSRYIIRKRGVKHEPQHGSSFDSKQAGFWRSKIGHVTAAQREQATRDRVVNHLLNKGKKSAQEVRILWLKKRHQIAKLMRKYPEVDWYAEERSTRRRENFAKARKGKP